MPRYRASALVLALAACALSLALLPNASRAQEGPDRPQLPPAEPPPVISAEPRPGVDLSDPPAPPPLTPTRPAPVSPTPEPSGEGSGVGPAGVSFPIAGDVTRTGPFNIVMNASYNQSSTATVNYNGGSFIYTFTDSGGLLPGAGCSAGDSFTVFCGVSDAVTINVNLGSGPDDGTDNAFIYRVDTIDALVLAGGEGNDTVTVGNTGGSIAGFGTLSLSGTSGTDHLFIDDSLNSAAATYTLATGAFQRDANNVISYSGFFSLAVDAGSNNDTINVNSTNVITSINGFEGNDAFTVGAGDLDQVLGPVQVTGHNGDDTVTVNDSATSYSDSYSITSSQITRVPYFGGLTYDTIDSLTLNAEQGSNYFGIGSIAVGTAMTINGAAGYDNFLTGNLDYIPNTLTVNGDADDDTLYVDDSTDTFVETYNIGVANIVRSYTGGVNFSGLEGATLSSTSVGSLVNVNAAAIPWAIYGNGGNDGFNWGAGLIEAFADSTIDGGPGTDAIYVQDSANSFNDPYTLTNTTFTRFFSGTLSYSTIESFLLNAASDGNDITASSTATNVSYALNGLGGNDTLTVGPNLATMLGPITFDGGGNTDVLNVDDTSGGSGYSYAMRAGRVERLTGAPSRDIDYTSTEAVQLFTGNNGDNVSLMATSPGTQTNVYLGGGTDGVNLFLAGLAGTGLATATLYGGPDNDVIFVFNGGLSFSDVGGNSIQTIGRHDVNYFEFEGPPNPFGTGADYDADGCPDAKEVGLNPIFGGDRSPFYNYDWFDVTHDKTVDVNDVLAVLQRFGLVPGAPIPGWDQSFDRGPGPAPKLYRNIATQNGIDVADAIANLQSFGHNCN